jgi:hypothetical protein
MNQRPFLGYWWGALFRFQAPNRFRVFDQFLRAHAASCKKPPPCRPCLPAVIFEKLAGKPAVVAGLNACHKLFAQALARVERLCRFF